MCIRDRVKVIPLDMFVRIDIIDEGIGIHKNEINNIFKRFYRSEDVKEVKGLGAVSYTHLIRTTLKDF